LFGGFQSRAGYPSNGPAAGAGYVLPAQPKVKLARNQRAIALKVPELDRLKLKAWLAGVASSLRPPVLELDRPADYL